MLKLWSLLECDLGKYGISRNLGLYYDYVLGESFRSKYNLIPCNGKWIIVNLLSFKYILPVIDVIVTFLLEITQNT